MELLDSAPPESPVVLLLGRTLARLHSTTKRAARRSDLEAQGRYRGTESLSLHLTFTLHLTVIYPWRQQIRLCILVKLPTGHLLPAPSLGQPCWGQLPAASWAVGVSARLRSGALQTVAALKLNSAAVST